MIVLVGAVCWFAGAVCAWAFIRGAELMRRRDAMLGILDPDIGQLDDEYDDSRE